MNPENKSKKDFLDSIDTLLNGYDGLNKSATLMLEKIHRDVALCEEGDIAEIKLYKQVFTNLLDNLICHKKLLDLISKVSKSNIKQNDSTPMELKSIKCKVESLDFSQDSSELRQNIVRLNSEFENLLDNLISYGQGHGPLSP